MPSPDTATQLLDTAQTLIQERGYNAFSYKDLAETVGMRKASIHHHFPAKASLGVAVMERYIERLRASLAKIDSGARSNQAKIKAFIGLYIATEKTGAICLCGSLATDRQTLPTEMQDAVARYIQCSEDWVTERVKLGVAAGEFGFAGKPRDVASSLLSSLQGGLIMSRAQTNNRPLLTTIQRVFLQVLQAHSA